MIGIDPGLKGGIAWYQERTDGQNPLTTWDMPLSNYRAKKEVDGQELACILSEIPLEVPVFIEEVGAMPGNGVVSMFRFGMGYGQVLGVCASQHRKIYRVRPNVWKALLGLSSDKQASLKLARHTFPGYVFENDGQAEAALLAKLGHDQFTMVKSAQKAQLETSEDE